MEEPRLMSSEAAKSALQATSDSSLRVPCFCEENVWRLAYRKIHRQRNGELFHVAFVSNPRARVPMFEQLAVEDRDEAVIWDYHVILLMTTTASEDSIAPKTYVLDIDSYLPYPCPMEEYVERVFLNHTEWDEEFLPYFRDRSHMYNTKTKTWNATPPPYKCILAAKNNDESKSERERKTNTINTYMTISDQNIADSQKQNSRGSPYGHIYSLSQLLQRFGLQIEEQKKVT